MLTFFTVIAFIVGEKQTGGDWGEGWERTGGVVTFTGTADISPFYVTNAAVGLSRVATG